MIIPYISTLPLYRVGTASGCASCMRVVRASRLFNKNYFLYPEAVGTAEDGSHVVGTSQTVQNQNLVLDYPL